MADLQSGRGGCCARPLSSAVRDPADLCRASQCPRHHARSRARSWRNARADTFPGGAAAVPGRSVLSLRHRVSQCVGRLCHADVPRRRFGDHARPVHCPGILDALQLAGRCSNVLHADGCLPHGSCRGLHALPEDQAMTRAPHFTWALVLALFAVFMLGPLILVVLFSFNAGAMVSFPMSGFTLNWYAMLIDSPEFWSALFNSLAIAGPVAILSTITGTMTAMVLSQWKSRFAYPLLTALSVPIMIPPLVVAIGLIVLYVRWLSIPLGLP